MCGTYTSHRNILCSFQSTTSFLRRQPLLLGPPVRVMRRVGVLSRVAGADESGRAKGAQNPSQTRAERRSEWALGTVPGSLLLSPGELVQTCGTRVCKNKRGSGWGMGAEKRWEERQSREGIKGKEGKQLVALIFTF